MGFDSILEDEHEDAPSGLGRFFMHFLGFRFTPSGSRRTIIRARLRRLRASVLGHDQKQVNGLGNRPKIYLSSRHSGQPFIYDLL